MNVHCIMLSSFGEHFELHFVIFCVLIFVMHLHVLVMSSVH
jgi:hypothetical protein